MKRLENYGKTETAEYPGRIIVHMMQSLDRFRNQIIETSLSIRSQLDAI